MLGELWCWLFHSEITRPIYDHYTCLQCGRVYKHNLAPIGDKNECQITNNTASTHNRTAEHADSEFLEKCGIVPVPSISPIFSQTGHRSRTKSTRRYTASNTTRKD